MTEELLIKYSQTFRKYLIDQGMIEEWAMLLNVVFNSILVIIVLYVVNAIFRSFLIKVFKAITLKTRTTFDDHLVATNFPRYATRLIPIAILWRLIPILFQNLPTLSHLSLLTLKVYLVVLWGLIIRSSLRALRAYLSERDRFRDKPLDSYVQVMMIFTWGIAFFWILQLLTGHSMKIFATLGAASAVILLIFKDTILGFVASIQVSVNDMVRIGDWITFDKFGADGDVVEINLATVRVQNWDKTYTTIPTYSLISDSFKNWRGMSESGGRRIKRSIYIKQSSIKFLSAEDLERFKKIELVKNYIEHRQRDIEKHNAAKNINKEIQINGRNQTNLGVFRHYMDTFINENSAIHKDLSLMVRHLAPTDKGIPLEIYCFSRDQRWVNYEHIQADIFEHLLAALPYFDLEVFELPTGKDVTNINRPS